MNLKALFTRVKKDDLFNLYPDATLILDSEGKISDINMKAVDLFEFSRFNMIGESASKYIIDATNKINQALNQEKSVVVKIECASKAEKFADISVLRDEENEKIYMTLRDVTQNYKKQNLINGEYEIVKNITDDKNRYLTANATEILSCVSSIESFSKALLDGVSGKLVTKQEKYVNIINKNAKDLLYNLDKMFLLFKVESDLWPRTYKAFDIVNFLNETTKKWSDKFKEKNIRFSCDFSNIGLRNACLDPVALEVMVNCLLEASFKNTEVGSSTFTVSNPTTELLEGNGFEVDENEDLTKSYLLFEFKDTSTPLNEEEMSSIFSPYVLIRNPQKRPIGTKFTYPLIRKFIKNLGGEMWVVSKPSLGTIVNFIIPIEKKVQKK